jgi:hypothetical protein
MKEKLKIGTIVVLVLFMVFTGVIVFALPLVVWTFLVWMVWKKKTDIFHYQVELKLTERSLKRLKAFLLVAGISCAGFIVGVILHNVIYGLSEIEEPVFFSIALFSLGVFYIANIGGLVIFLKGQRKQDKGIPK